VAQLEQAAAALAIELAADEQHRLDEVYVTRRPAFE